MRYIINLTEAESNVKGVGETACFPVEEGSESSSVGKPWVSEE
jgi:hypothetical protein